MALWCHVRNCTYQVGSILDWINHMNDNHPRHKDLTQLISTLLIQENFTNPISYPVYVPYRIEEPPVYPYNPWSPFYVTSTTTAGEVTS